MLIKESKFTLLSYDIKKQIKNLISSFVNTYISKRGKLSGLTLDQAKANVKKMIYKNKHKILFIGYLDLQKAINRSIPVYIKETESGGSYIRENEDYIEHIIVSYDTMFSNLEFTLSVLAHEVIHAIQKYSINSPKYYDVASKIGKGEELTKQEDFTYYTEPREFEANASQLAYMIVRFYERRDVDKSKVLYVLDSVLKFPKQRMYKFFNSFYIRYVMNLPSEDQDIYISYLREMFLDKLEFLKTISDPPDNTSRNIKKSNRYWRQFKQKLFSLVQNLKKRHLNKQKKNK